MKIFLDMVGCRLNQSELESYARQFRLAGHCLTAGVEQADLVVINTCTVTASAASDSRQKIRQASRSGARQVVVTGCWSTLNRAEAMAIPGVTQVIGSLEKDDLVPLVLNLPVSEFANNNIHREPIPGKRLRTRAFIKVQDGCDNHCTYCITALARGSGRSRPIPEILADIHSALQGGSQEVVLTGVHLGSWGYDFDIPSDLSDLVKVILDHSETPRLHLSSLEPWDVSPKLLALFQNPRLCRHLHLPLQSGCEATLKRMGRRTDPHSYAGLVHEARATIPGVAITTDVITGFPGESDAEFAQSAAFIEELMFTNGHVFTYSTRPGTAAARLPNQVPIRVAKQRNAWMRQLFQRCATDFLQAQVGQDMNVLWEKAVPLEPPLWQLRGLTDNYLHVRAVSPADCHNQIMHVHITGIDQGKLLGEITRAQSNVLEAQDTI